MESLREQFKNPTIFSPLCNVSLGIFEPHIKRIEANAVKSHCKAMQDDIVSCKNPNISTFLEEVDGLDFNTVKIQQKLFNPPFLIPIINRGIFKFSGDEIESETIGVSLKDIFSSGPSKRNGRQVQPKLSLDHDALRSPIFKNKKVILFGSGRDVLIERLWQEEFYKPDFAKAVSIMGFTAVTGINFSVFRGECPFAQALNLKKSIKTAEYFHAAHVLTIPHIYFAHELHLERLIKWLNLNPSIRVITINCQFRRLDDAVFTEEGLIYLIENLGRKIKIILEGPDPRKMPRLFKNYFNWIVVATKGISMSARFHHQYELVGNRLLRINQAQASITNILNKSIKSYLRYLKNMTSR